MAPPRARRYNPAMIDREDQAFRALVGANADYYLAVHRRMRETGNRLVWNWAAFAFSVAWLAWRGMWGAAIVLCCLLGAFFMAYSGLYLTGAIVPSGASAAGTAAGALVLRLAMIFGVPIFCGLFGNHLYLKRVEARLRSMREAGPG
jgi:hypothetical protein